MMGHENPHFASDGACLCVKDCCTMPGNICICRECDQSACTCTHEIPAPPEPEHEAITLTSTFTRYWRCEPYGWDAYSRCTSADPHPNWNCDWRWRTAELTDDQVDRARRARSEAEGLGLSGG